MSKFPQWGDAEMRSDDPTVRPNAGSLPFGPSGELLPVAPVNVSAAPDIEGLPWKRRFGQGWTAPAFRGEMLTWLSGRVHTRSWVHAWQVLELLRLDRSSVLKVPVLCVVLRRENDTLEVCLDFDHAERVPGPLLEARLSLLAEIFEALNAGPSVFKDLTGWGLHQWGLTPWGARAHRLGRNPGPPFDDGVPRGYGTSPWGAGQSWGFAD